MSSEKEYLDVVGFIEEGRERKRKPVTIGYAYRNDKGDLSIKLRSVPVGSWDGSLVVQKRQERQERTDAPRGNGGGQRSQQQGRGGGDGYGDSGDSSDIPFISQADTTRGWLR